MFDKDIKMYSCMCVRKNVSVFYYNLDKEQNTLKQNSRQLQRFQKLDIQTLYNQVLCEMTEMTENWPFCSKVNTALKLRGRVFYISLFLCAG